MKNLQEMQENVPGMRLTKRALIVLEKTSTMWFPLAKEEQTPLQTSSLNLPVQTARLAETAITQ